MDIRLEKTDSFSLEDYNMFIASIPEKLECLNRKVFLEDRIQSAYGYYLSKEMISKRLNCKPEELLIQTNIFGKPFMKDCPLQFNISHSSKYVICVVDNFEVGVDIEEIQPFEQSDLDFVCSEAEVDYIQEANDIFEKEKRFCEVWTFKEAFLKLRGADQINYRAITMMEHADLFIREMYNNFIITICSYHIRKDRKHEILSTN